MRLAQELLVMAAVAVSGLVLMPVWRSLTPPADVIVFTASAVAMTLGLDWVLDHWGREE